MSQQSELRNAICEVGRRLYNRNLVAATDGNISARLSTGRYLCTPSGSQTGFLNPQDLVIVDDSGAKIEGAGAVSSEFLTHLAAYQIRPEINAVVHAHPPKAVALTLAGISMAEYILPEVVYSLGAIPTARYATPGTAEGAEVIRELIAQCDALLLDRHGALTVGFDVMDAYLKMEKIEHGAQTIFAARRLGKVRPLKDEEVERLIRAREAHGATGKVYEPSRPS